MLQRFASDRGRIAVYAAIVLLAVAGQSAIAAFGLTAFLHDIGHRYGAVRLDEYLGLVFVALFVLIAILVVRSRELSAEIRGRKEAEMLVQKLARNDALTGLPNRRCFTEELERRIGASGGQVAVLLIDLDRFKPVNEAYGHACGDRLLQAVTDRLYLVIHPGEFVARMGADEFAVLTDSVADPERPARLARRLLAALERTFEIDGRKVDISASIGIGLSDIDASDAPAVLQRADIALFRAKSCGRNTFAFFEAGFDEQVHARARIEAELRNALRNGEIVPYFQPLVSIRDGTVTGFEILARWHGAERGEVSPEDFIPVAEDTGMISDIAWTLMRQACRVAVHWDPSITIAINLSPVQFHDRWLAEKVMAILAETGFPPGRLEIEITENALVADFETARATILSLKNQGVRIALDDFGTGYSSLHSLRDLPFDKIKIDRSFVSSHIRRDDSCKIVAAIISLSHSLGLPTTAEGIETAAAARWLAELGCDQGQGFFYSPPLAAEDAAALLARPAAATCAPLAPALARRATA